jgi:glucose/arabinose dehydrogenase
MRNVLSLVAAVALAGLAFAEEAKDGENKLPLEQLKAPKGFQVELYASGLRSPRSLALGDKGTIFIGTRNNPEGVVYALVDADGDHVAEKTLVVAKGLDMPNGVAFHKGTLYIAEQGQILKLENIEAQLENPPAPVTVIGGFPLEGFHVWKFLAVGPDEKLYYNIGAPCDACDREADDGDRKANLRFSTIERCNLDGSGVETVARGVRQSVGFAWHPVTKELWFTDNGRDKLGDDRPHCELNHVTELGQHFGFPFCHGGDTPDPVLGEKRPCSDFVAPAQQLGPHVTPLGLRFYTGDMFPEKYKNRLLIAEHGSAERSIKLGYSVMQVKTGDDGKCSDYEPFVEGWLQRDKNWGRPVDVLVDQDGAVLVSDDQAGAIYRISYKK